MNYIYLVTVNKYARDGILAYQAQYAFLNRENADKYVTDYISSIDEKWIHDTDSVYVPDPNVAWVEMSQEVIVTKLKLQDGNKGA